MKKRILTIVLAIAIFIAGFVVGFLVRGLITDEPEHIHAAEGEWVTDGESHWKVCSCGEIMDKTAHNGGEATYDEKAVCEVCLAEYGEVLERPHSHEAGEEWVADGENHWKTCDCGEIMEKDVHMGGTATTEKKAVCEVCGKEYGELAEPAPEPEPDVHTHKSEGKWKSDDNNHWKVCSCGEITDKSAHKGGTATAEKKAVCEVCGKEYGELAEPDPEPTPDPEPQPEPEPEPEPHTHVAEGSWVSDAEEHWKVCDCGEIMNKSAHTGGTATAEKKAICTVCGAEYGEFAQPEPEPHTHNAEGNWKTDANNHWKTCSCGEVMYKSAHTGGTATADKKAVCSVCGVEYGEFAESIQQPENGESYEKDPDEGAEDEF